MRCSSDLRKRVIDFIRVGGTRGGSTQIGPKKSTRALWGIMALYLACAGADGRDSEKNAWVHQTQPAEKKAVFTPA